MRSEIVSVLLRIYKLFVSPMLHLLAGPGMGCRFQPTCSEYASESIRVHGMGKGTFLAIHRICRCHPFSSGGYDPVPECPERKHLEVT